MYGNQLSPSMGMEGTPNVPQTNQIAMQSMIAKEQSKIQGQIFMAKQFPREIGTVMNKIKSSCERVSLAKIAEYEYPRGGQKITGASIRLLEVVAQCYGNISYSWKELNRNMETHNSTVLAFAWDLESNLYSELEFDVPHFRTSKNGGRQLLTDDRDIYELISNQASRRVRRCLENVVPRDIVDEAREYCNDTLNSKIDYQAGIDKALKFFEENYNVKLSQIEEYFGMSRRAFTQQTYIRLQKIYASVKDGMSKIEDYFKPQDSEESGKKLNSLKPKTETKADAPKVEEEQPSLL